MQFKHGEDLVISKMLREVKIAEIMTKDVISLYEDEPLSLDPGSFSLRSPTRNGVRLS